MSYFKTSSRRFLLNHLQKNTEPKDTTKTSYHLNLGGLFYGHRKQILSNMKIISC